MAPLDRTLWGEEPQVMGVLPVASHQVEPGVSSSPCPAVTLTGPPVTVVTPGVPTYRPRRPPNWSLAADALASCVSWSPGTSVDGFSFH